MPSVKILGLLTLLLVGSYAQADTLLIDGLDASSQTGVSRPRRGMTMTSVEASFGAPAARIPPVGDPPIARWEYPGFVVFFEYDHVIHAVERR